MEPIPVPDIPPVTYWKLNRNLGDSTGSVSTGDLDTMAESGEEEELETTPGSFASLEHEMERGAAIRGRDHEDFPEEEEEEEEDVDEDTITELACEGEEDEESGSETGTERKRQADRYSLASEMRASPIPAPRGGRSQMGSTSNLNKPVPLPRKALPVTPLSPARSSSCAVHYVACQAVPSEEPSNEHWNNLEASPGIAMEYKVHVDPGREECYYQSVQPGATIYVSFQVLRGGDGMAGFAVRNPQGQLVHPYQWKQASEYQEVSATGGYYAICVDNQFSRFAAKLVNLYITTFRYDQWEKYTQELKDADISVGSFTSTLSGVDKRVQEMLQYQQLSRGKEARDFNILEANNKYVQYWSLAQCSVIILATTVQVYFVKKLFETKSGSGRGRF
nr:EOG090X0AV2 [Triops cancriformis]